MLGAVLWARAITRILNGLGAAGEAQYSLEVMDIACWHLICQHHAWHLETLTAAVCGQLCRHHEQKMEEAVAAWGVAKGAAEKRFSGARDAAAAAWLAALQQAQASAGKQLLTAQQRWAEVCCSSRGRSPATSHANSHMQGSPSTQPLRA